MCAEPMHTSDCHTCSETSHDLKIHRIQVLSAQYVGLPASSVPLLILSERKPFLRKPVVDANGTLSALQTIRLLI